VTRLSAFSKRDCGKPQSANSTQAPPTFDASTISKRRLLVTIHLTLKL